MVVMSTPMVATILLMHRRGISLDTLVKRVSWLYDEIKARKGEVGLTAAPSSAIVSQCLNFLSEFVNRNRDIFQPSVQAKKGDKNILMLTYYRNNLIHHFINESYIACTLLGISNIHEIGRGVNINEIWTRVEYLKKLLSNEFVYRKTMKDQNDLIKNIKFLAKRGFLNYDEVS